MARGSGGEAKSMEELGVSAEEVLRYKLAVLERKQQQTLKFLTKAMETLNHALGREGKVKGDVVELSASIVALTDTMAGLYGYEVQRTQDHFETLKGVGEYWAKNEHGKDVVVKPRDLNDAVNSVRFRVQFLKSVVESLERQLKESGK